MEKNDIQRLVNVVETIHNLNCDIECANVRYWTNKQNKNSKIADRLNSIDGEYLDNLKKFRTELLSALLMDLETLRDELKK